MTTNNIDVFHRLVESMAGKMDNDKEPLAVFMVLYDEETLSIYVHQILNPVILDNDDEKENREQIGKAVYRACTQRSTLVERVDNFVNPNEPPPKL